VAVFALRLWVRAGACAAVDPRISVAITADGR
jgi:hypothetical protein